MVIRGAQNRDSTSPWDVLRASDQWQAAFWRWSTVPRTAIAAHGAANHAAAPAAAVTIIVVIAQPPCSSNVY